MTLAQLLVILLGNFVGTFITALLVYFTSLGVTLRTSAQVLISTRLANGFLSNFALSILCGLLVVSAVKLFRWSNGNLFMVMLPVMIFILCGFGHCIADSFYFWLLDGYSWSCAYNVLIPEIFGNFVGCCFMGMVLDT